MHTSAALALTLLLAAPGAFSPSALPAHRENLLRGPARLVLRYLDAVRLAEPPAADRLAEPPAADRRAGKLHPREAEVARANRLVAPRALAEAERSAARNEEHPLAFWRRDGRGPTLEGFQLLAVRRAPRSSVVVTVEERYRDQRATDGRLARTVSEYLVARVAGEWRVVDRRSGARFDDDAILAAYDGWWDGPPISLAR